MLTIGIQSRQGLLPGRRLRFGNETEEILPPAFVKSVKGSSALKLVLKLDETLEQNPESPKTPGYHLMEQELVRKLETMKGAFQKGFSRVLSCRANVLTALNNALNYTPSPQVNQALTWEVTDPDAAREAESAHTCKQS